MFQLRSFTHIAIRQEYQFPFCVIFLLEEHEAKRSNLILIPGDTGYIERLMNFCINVCVYVCAVYLRRIKALERERLMIARWETFVSISAKRIAREWARVAIISIVSCALALKSTTANRFINALSQLKCNLQNYEIRVTSAGCRRNWGKPDDSNADH